MVVSSGSPSNISPGNRTYRKPEDGLYNANGTRVNIGYNLKQNLCKDMCADTPGSIGWALDQYPKGHPFYPYYHCSCWFKAS